jgi:hypothetical protein
MESALQKPALEEGLLRSKCFLRNITYWRSFTADTSQQENENAILPQTNNDARSLTCFSTKLNIHFCFNYLLYLLLVATFKTVAIFAARYLILWYY